MKFNFRKISAVIASGLMTVSAVGFAAAANFPAPFVVGGSADGAVVYGTGAGALDQTPANSIGNYLSSKVTVGSGAPSGENVLFEKSSDKLNFGDNLAAFKTTIDKDDLPIILADGTYTADDSDTFDYEQTIKVGAPILSHFRDTDYEGLLGLDKNTPAVGFHIADGTNLLNYTLDFITDAESDLVSATDLDLDDIEGSDLMLFGKTYYVSDLQNGTGASGYLGKLTLLDSATTATVGEGDTITVTTGGQTYEVSMRVKSTSQVYLTINGKETNALSEGGSASIGGDIYVGVRDLAIRDVTGTTGSASFSIGSGKLEITSGSDIKLNDETITGVKGYVHAGTGTSTTAKIDKIEIRWTVDDEMFLTSASEIVMPGFGGLKFTMADLVRPTEEKISINSDSETVELVVPIKDGDASFHILYAERTAGNITGIGKAADERLATSNTSSLLVYDKQSSVDYHKYFVASYATTSESESYLLKVNTEQDTTAGRNETIITNVVTGVDVCKDRSSANTDCNIGDVSLTINAVNHSSTERVVDITGGSGVSFNTIYTKGGLKIYLPYSSEQADTANGAIYLTANTSGTTAGHNTDSYFIFMDGEDKDDTIAGGTEFKWTTTNTGTAGSKNLHITALDGASDGNSGKELQETNSFENYIVGTNNATVPRIMHYTGSDNSDYAEVYYPTGDSETYAKVYLTSEGTTLSAAGQMVFKDSEKSSWSNKNVVVVGGSCINSAAADLLGGALCESAFTDATGVGAGQYVVQSFADGFTSGKVALLVAGYHAADTVAAASRLIEPGQTVDTTAGTKYIGTVGVSGSSTMNKQ